MPANNNNKKPKIRIHTEEGAVSPYIIHLSREETEAAQTAASPNLDALAQALTEEAEQYAEPENDLSLDFQDLVEQLRESDFEHQAVPSVDDGAQEVATDVITAPIDSSAFVNSTEIRESILDQETIVRNEIRLLNSDEEETEEEYRPGFFERMNFSFALPTIAGPHTRAVAAFVALSFALVLPLHAIQQVNATKLTQVEITDAGRNAIDNFLRGTQALEGDRFDVAGIDFQRATEDFKEAEDSLKDLDTAVGALVNVIPQTDKTYESVRGLITAGKELSLAASNLTTAAEDLAGRESITATTKLTLLNSYVENALPHIETAEKALEKVKPEVIPGEYQAAVADLKTRTPELGQSMREFSEFSETLVTVMGGERKMRYLVVFQNNTELRPTGGFPGSFAEMDVLDGEIVSINIPEGGTYDVQGQLSKFVQSPAPLSLINPRWEFHDAGWFADFPTARRNDVVLRKCRRTNG